MTSSWGDEVGRNSLNPPRISSPIPPRYRLHTPIGQCPEFSLANGLCNRQNLTDSYFPPWSVRPWNPARLALVSSLVSLLSSSACSKKRRSRIRSNHNPHEDKNSQTPGVIRSTSYHGQASRNGVRAQMFRRTQLTDRMHRVLPWRIRT